MFEIKLLEKFINTYVAKEKRERLLFLLSKPKRIDDLLWNLFHDTRNFQKKLLIDLSKDNEDQVLIKLNTYFKKQTVFVFTTYMMQTIENEQYSYNIEDAFNKRSTWSEDKLFISENNKVAYYENHEQQKYLLITK
jgi:hypothetical protein